MSVSKAQLRGRVSHYFDPIAKIKKNVFSDCLKRLYDKSSCLRSVGRLLQTRGPRPTDEKCMSVSRAQSSLAGVGQ